MMKSRPAMLVICCALWLSQGGVPAALGESAGSLNARGNELFSQGNLDEALNAYDAALELQPESGELHFNKGAVLFRQGDFDKARGAFETAALQAGDPSVEARAQYNLGNTTFSWGQNQMQQNPQEAMESFGRAVRHFREALRLAPDLQAAGENLEMVRLHMKDLDERIRQQKEEAEKQRRQREEARRLLREAIESQQQAGGMTEDARRKQAETRDALPAEEKDNLRTAQEDAGEDTARAREKVQSLPPEPASDGEKVSSPSAADHLQSAAEEQKAAEENLQADSLDEAKEHQARALESLEEALARLEDPKESKKSCPNPQPGQDGQEAKGDKEQESPPKPDQAEEKSPQSSEEQRDGASEEVDSGSRKEAARMENPKDILKEEKENRAILQRSFMSGHRSVEKDW